MNEMPKWGRGTAPKDSVTENPKPEKDTAPDPLDEAEPADVTPAEKIEGRWGRDAKPLPSTGEKLAKAAGDIGDAIGETASAAAQKTGAAFNDAAETVTEAATEVKRQWLSKKQKIYATGIAGAAATAFFGGWLVFKDYVSLDKTILRVDANAAEKCFSQYDRSEFKSPEAERKKNQALSLMSLFGTRGTATAKKLAASEYTFCYGIDAESVLPRQHWPIYDVYFSSSKDPIEMAALYMASEDKVAFWAGKITTASDINQYTPESGLIFSRASAAVQAVEDIRNFYRALEESRAAKGDINAYEWKVFLNEKQALQNAVAVYIDSMKESYNEAAAMEAATLTFMKDAAAVSVSDANYLTAYNHHVKILEDSSHTYIYEESTGFFSGNREFALVDADRDGRSDDLIEIETGLFTNNNAIGYQYDYGISDWGLKNKRESYDCGYTDSEGNEVEQTCYCDAQESVYFKVIPARETASVRLSPLTLIDMAKLSETDFLSREAASKIVQDFSFAQTYGTNAALMDTIKRNQAANIPPGRDTGQAVPGLGLH